jgi:hypothetical protein
MEALTIQAGGCRTDSRHIIPPMAGSALGRLWDTHPRVAFAFHLIITAMMGGFAVMFLRSGREWVVALITTAGFMAMAATLVFFIWLAIQDHWSSSG